MWEITYTIDNHYRDRDNYAACRTSEPCFAEGETFDAAVEDLMSRLESNGNLKYLIETKAKNLCSYDDCCDISIVSVNEVISSVSLDFDKHPLFLSLIDKRKNEINTEEKQRVINLRKATRAKELRVLKELKSKYEQKG